jgi:N-acetylmuramoyl-L-alanine amidase
MKRQLNRREFLVLTALSAAACGGVCTVGAVAGTVLLRRAAATATPVPTQTPIPTPVGPAILPREAWNARLPNHEAEQEKGFAAPGNPLGWYVYEGDLSKIYRTVAIHHSYPIRRDNGTMLDIQNLHMDEQKWADIAYHYGIDGKGTIYAGRDIHVRGASVAGHNTGTLGVVLIGDFQQETPAAAQLDSVLRLIVWLKAIYRLTHLAGHSEFNPETVCPGTNLRPYLDPLAKGAGLLRGTGGYIVPTPFPTTTATPRCC